MGRVLLLLVIAAGCRAACLLPAAPQSGAPSTPEALLDEGHFRKAVAMLAPEARDAHALWIRSRAEVGLGHLDQALPLAEQAVAMDAGKAEFHVQLAAVNGLLAEKASMLKQLGYAKRAKKELDTALELNPRNIDALYGTMLFYYAAPSFVGGDKQKATDAASLITRLDAARGNLAQARLAKDRKDPVAEEDFYRQAIAANPKFYEARASLASFELPRDLNAAEQIACDALPLDSGRVEAWQVLAEVYVREQCWDEMFTLLDRAKAFVPDNGAYFYSAATALARIGMHPRWQVQFLRAYLAGPMEGESFAAQAQALLQAQH